LIAALAGAVAWPLMARAQQPGKVPTIGFLGPESAAMKPWATAFARRLGELGWKEGRTVAIEYRWADGHIERFPEIAAEFVRLKVDVIVTTGSAVPAFKSRFRLALCGRRPRSLHGWSKSPESMKATTRVRHHRPRHCPTEFCDERASVRLTKHRISPRDDAIIVREARACCGASSAGRVRP
jgi:hypothetical protein